MRPAQPSAAGQQDLEAKLFAEELRALSQRPRSATPDSVPPEVITLPASELIDEEPSQPTAAARRSDRLGLDAFDEDLDVRPVVLLSRKRKNADQIADGAFMSDLERRIEAEPSNRAGEEPRSQSGGPDPVRSS